jgi:membrane protein
MGHTLATSAALRQLRQFSRLKLEELLALCGETLNEWSNDKAQRLGAALAFYTLLSLAPLLVVAVAVAAFAFGREAVEGQLAWQIQSLAGREAAQAVQALIRASHRPTTGLIATVFSILTLLSGASSVVVELHDTLNTIWHIPPRTFTIAASLIGFVKERFFSFALVIGGGVLLLASLLWSAWIALMGKFFGPFLPIPEFALHIAAFLVSFLAVAILFAAIYKIFPDVNLKWSDVIVGASVTSLVFTLGKQLIALYLGKESLGSTYGAAGSLVVLLVWVYYSAQLFFLGAEFTKVYTKTFGSHFSGTLQPSVPRPAATVVTASDSAQVATMSSQSEE